jgi:serine/threonine-protein kinase RsbW
MPVHEFSLEAPAADLTVPVVRAMAAAVAMVHDIAMEDITDVRLAVDEACSMLLPLAAPDTALRCVVEIGTDDVTIDVSVLGASADDLPAADSTALLILDSLAAHVETRTVSEPSGATRLVIALRLPRSS